MVLDQGWIVDQLIVYWSRDAVGASAETRQTCRQIVAELATSLSGTELLAWQEEPEVHRRKIERAVHGWLATRSPSRDMAGAPIKPVVPPSSAGQPAAPAWRATPPVAAPSPRQGTRIEQHTSGGMAVGEIHELRGGIHLALPAHAAPGGDRSDAVAGAAAREKIVRILFLGANPADSTRLRIDEEVREIDRALDSAELGRRCELCQGWAVRASDLQRFLLRTKPRVLHFSGHGSQESAIILETDDGGSRPVDAARLANLLKQFNKRLSCVVLNACYSAEQGEAIAEHIDCVIGMSAAVADRAAIRFASAFYRAVAWGCSVQEAFDQACADIEVGELAQDQVPTLIARRCDPSKLILVAAE